MSKPDSNGAQKKRGFFRSIGRGAVKAADYTILPVRELKSLKNMLALSIGFFKELALFSWAIIRANSRDLVSSRFYKKIASQADSRRYADVFTHEEQQILLEGLSSGFFIKRLIGISFVFILFLCSAASFFVGLFSSEPSYFRLIVMIFITGFIGLYLWVSMLHFERLRSFYYTHGGTILFPSMKDAFKRFVLRFKKERLPMKEGDE